MSLIENSSSDGLIAAGRGGDPSRGGAAACGESRLVIRDERKDKKNSLVSDESKFPAVVDEDYESEIYRIEARGLRGEIISYPKPYDAANPRMAHVDWCAFTLKPPQFKTPAWVMGELTRLLGFEGFTPRATGLYGYKESAIIEDGGLIAWGGQRQRGTVYVSINAQGCARIADWEKLRTWFECHKARITRIDIAHDDFTGETVNIENSREWYHAGGFGSGGRKPESSQAGDWWLGKKGRTVYIGNRAHGKLLRIYEKGKQLGDPESAWVRAEMELHNKSRVIPLDALTRPAAYLAGAYPCFRYLSVEQCKIKTISKAAKTSYRKAVAVAKQQYGKLVNLMLQVRDGDYVAVLNELKREGLPARLEPYSYFIRTSNEVLGALGSAGGGDAALVT